MEIMDTISFPYRVEIELKNGNETNYENLPGIQSLHFDQHGISEKVTFVSIDFLEDNSLIDNIGIVCGFIPLVGKIEESPTDSQAKAICTALTAMVSHYDEFAMQEMIDREYEYRILQNTCFFRREEIDGRIRYRPAFRK